MRDHVFYLLLFLQVDCRMGQLVGLLIALLCLLEMVKFPHAISFPRKGQSLLWIFLDSLFKTLYRLFIFFQSIVCTSQIVIIDTIVRLKFDSFEMALNGLVIVFVAIVASSQVSMVCRNIWVHLNGLRNKLYLLIFIAHFSQSLSFEMIKRTFFCKLKPLPTTIVQFLPIPQPKPSINFNQVFLFPLFHAFHQIQNLPILFLSPQFLDLLFEVLAFSGELRLAIVKLFQLDLHVLGLKIEFISKQSLIYSTGMVPCQFLIIIKMIKRMALTLVNTVKRKPSTLNPFKYNPTSSLTPYFQFCSNKALTPSDIPQENLKVKAATTTLGEQEIDYFKTEGGISILDKVQGVKAADGQLYVLSFTCTKCNTKSIRSFTKHAYHKGVVLVRCGGCPHIHLVADNLGWFNPEPINIETMHQGQVKKVHDHVAIVKFLQKALGEDSDVASNESKLNQETKEGTESFKEVKNDENIEETDKKE